MAIAAVHTYFLVLITLYVAILLLLSYQIGKIIYYKYVVLRLYSSYRHDPLSFRTVFLALCTLWVLFRSYYFYAQITPNHADTTLDDVIFVYVVVLILC